MLRLARQGRGKNEARRSYTLVNFGALQQVPGNPKGQKVDFIFEEGTVFLFSARAIDRWGPRQNRRGSPKNSDDGFVTAETTL